MSVSSPTPFSSKATQIAALSFNKKAPLRSYESVCAYIEVNKDIWFKKLDENPTLVEKHRKNADRAYSIYISRNSQTGKNQCFIHLGSSAYIGSGYYKVVTEAIEYETLSVASFAKSRLTEKSEGALNLNLKLLADRETYMFQRFPQVPELLQSLMIHDTVNSENIPQRIYVTPYSNIGDMEKAPKDLKLSEKYTIILDVVKALYVMHTTGHVHRDIKPANVLLHDTSSQNGHSDKRCIRAKLCDYGFSKKIEENDTLFMLTPLYTSPERFLVAADMDEKTSDVWSLGITLHEFFYLNHPFESLFELYYRVDRSKLNTAIKNHISTKYLEPSNRNSIDHLIWSMLRHNGKDRITVETAYDRLLDMQSIYNT